MIPLFCYKEEVDYMKNRKTFCIFVTFLLLILLVPTKLQAKTSKGIRFAKNKITLNVGSKKKLSVKGNNIKIAWKSSNKKVVTVSKKGVIKAKKKGKARITVSNKFGKATCVVTVVNKKNDEKSGSSDISNKKNEKKVLMPSFEPERTQEPKETPGTADYGSNISGEPSNQNPPIVLPDEGYNNGNTDVPQHSPGCISLCFKESTDVETLYTIMDGIEIESVYDYWKDYYDWYKNENNVDQEKLEMAKENVGKNYYVELKDKSDENLYNAIDLLKKNPMVLYANVVKAEYPN